MISKMCFITQSDPHRSKGAPIQEELSQSVTASWRREILSVAKTHAAFSLAFGFRCQGRAKTMNEWPSGADIFGITHTGRDLVGTVRVPTLQDFLLLFFFPQIALNFLPNSSFQKKPMAVMFYCNSWLASHYLLENPTPKSSHLGNTAVCVCMRLCAHVGVCVCLPACLPLYLSMCVPLCVYLFPHLHVLLPSY